MALIIKKKRQQQQQTDRQGKTRQKLWRLNEISVPVLDAKNTNLHKLFHLDLCLCLLL